MNEIQTFLILKYGSMLLAYITWYEMPPKEQDVLFTDEEHDQLCTYEYEVIHNFGDVPVAKRQG